MGCAFLWVEKFFFGFQRVHSRNENCPGLIEGFSVGSKPISWTAVVSGQCVSHQPLQHLTKETPLELPNFSQMRPTSVSHRRRRTELAQHWKQRDLLVCSGKSWKFPNVA